MTKICSVNFQISLALLHSNMFSIHLTFLLQFLSQILKAIEVLVGLTLLKLPVTRKAQCFHLRNFKSIWPSAQRKNTFRIYVSSTAVVSIRRIISFFYTWIPFLLITFYLKPFLFVTSLVQKMNRTKQKIITYTYSAWQLCVLCGG